MESLEADDTLNGGSLHSDRAIKKLGDMVMQLKVGMNERIGQLEKGQETILTELKGLKVVQIPPKASDYVFNKSSKDVRGCSIADTFNKDASSFDANKAIIYE